jgi:hypothetical protein
VPQGESGLVWTGVGRVERGRTHVGGVWMASEEVLSRWSGAAILVSPLS